MWWGRWRIETGQLARFKIGPRTLFAERLENEWRIANELADDHLETGIEVELPAPPADLLTLSEVRRFGVSTDEGNEIDLAAALADRPVVSRAERPVTIPSGGALTIYVSSPVWLRISTGDHGQTRLDEFPLVRPSDTWFGPTTLGGELCYAARSHFRVRLAEVHRRPHRAITAVLLRNEAASPLVLDRLLLPAPRLPLYCGVDGQLWTQDTSFIRESDDEFARVTIESGAPAAQPDAELLASPRLEWDYKMVRVFSTLFS